MLTPKVHPILRRIKGDHSFEKVVDKIPDTLFKYKSINSYTIDMFKKKQIYFASPNEFNDPFDCCIPLRYDLATNEEYKQHLVSVLINRRNYSLQDAVNALPKMLENYEFISYEDFLKYGDIELKHLQNAVRIFCLTTNTNNLLMWSHYADFHRGLCMGFNKNYLYYNTGNSIGKVHYGNEYPKLKIGKSGEPTYIPQLLNKSDCWKYENEFRIVTMGGVQIHEIEGHAITDVIFGCRTSQRDQQSIFDIVKSDEELNHIRFHKAKIIKHKYELEIEEISTP